MFTRRNMLLAGLMVPAAKLLADQRAWPQWRGPARDGYADEGEWPASLSDASKPTLLWEKTLGPSYSGPISDGQVVITTETVDKKMEQVWALSLADGSVKWSKKWEGAMSVPIFAAKNGSWIRSTPAMDSTSVYVGGIRDDLRCLDLATGEERWRMDFPKTPGADAPPFGCVCSPIVDSGTLYMQAGNAVYALDAATGQPRWNTMEAGADAMSNGAFSSPMLATLADRKQLIVQTRTTLAGLDPETGAELWSEAIEAFRGMNILTPTLIGGDRVFTSAYGGRSMLFDLRGEGEKVAVDLQWDSKEQAYMSSPVVIGDSIYVHLRNQRFTCLDVATGESRWTTEPFGEYWSMVVQNDKILALDCRGELLLIQASPESFQLIDQMKVADDAWAHLAVVGSTILVRSIDKMMAFRWGA
jgi:outer membrane protein assembly factor BamB